MHYILLYYVTKYKTKTKKSYINALNNLYMERIKLIINQNKLQNNVLIIMSNRPVKIISSVKHLKSQHYTNEHVDSSLGT